MRPFMANTNEVIGVIKNHQGEAILNTSSRTSNTHKGGHEKFVRLAMPHAEYLYEQALRLTNNYAQAEDLFQDTCLKALCAFDKFDGSSQCKAWLKKIMVNTYINMYNRKRKVIFYLHDEADISDFPDQRDKKYPSKERIDQETILRNFVSDDTRESLLSLQDDYRQTVILYDMLGFSYKEVADILDMPIGTVKSRLFRGRRLLKKYITDLRASHAEVN